MRHKRLISSLVAVVAVLIGLLVYAGPATAGTGLFYTVVDSDNDPYSGIYLRNGTDMTNVTRDSTHYMLYGTRVELVCGAWGTAVGPYANRRWHYVRVATGAITNTQGWIADRYLNTPNAANQLTPGEPECGSSPAPPSGTYVSSAQQVRFCVNTAIAGCGTVLGGIQTPTIGQNTSVSMVCWLDGSSYNAGYTTNRWFWVRSGVAEGFVTASAVRNQTSVAACSTNRPIWAAQTAVQRYGQTYASTADKSLFANGEWSPGPVGEWAGDCPKPPYVAWRAAGISIPKGNAISNYRAYANAGRISGGTPPVGALAFYDVTSYGHEVISLGNGLVLTTTGMDFSGTPNTVRSYAYWTHFLGWAMPA